MRTLLHVCMCKQSGREGWSLVMKHQVQLVGGDKQTYLEILFSQGQTGIGTSDFLCWEGKQGWLRPQPVYMANRQRKHGAS